VTSKRRTNRLLLGLGVTIVAGLILAVLLGEVPLSVAQYLEALRDPSSGPAEVLWQVRAPRAVCALVVGAALGMAGAVLQGLLRNPLADPGVLGVSATAALGAALAIVLGWAAMPGVVEGAALLGAGLAGAVLVVATRRLRSPEALVLFGVALSSLAGALTALIFNLSPSPIASAEVMSWLLGSVQNRSWIDVAWVVPPILVAGALASLASPGLRMLALGEEAASTSGLSMPHLKVLALIAAAIAAAISARTFRCGMDRPDVDAASSPRASIRKPGDASDARAPATRIGGTTQATSIQLRFWTDPKSQDMTSAEAIGDGDRLKIRAVRAPAILDRATPNRTKASGDRRRRVATTSTAPASPAPSRAAPSTTPGIAAHPRTMARAAPRAAVAETPSTPGSARGFLSNPCSTAPAIPRAAPTTRAQTARGARTCHRTSAGPDEGSRKASRY